MLRRILRNQTRGIGGGRRGLTGGGCEVRCMSTEADCLVVGLVGKTIDDVDTGRGSSTGAVTDTEEVS